MRKIPLGQNMAKGARQHQVRLLEELETPNRHSRSPSCHGLRWCCLSCAIPLRVRSQRVSLPETSHGLLRTYKREDKLEETFNLGSHKQPIQQTLNRQYKL